MNFTNSIDVTKIWDSVGTYNIYIPQEAKNIVETYWKSLFEGANGMYFNLAQYGFLSQLSLAPSYITFSNNEIAINLSNADKQYLTFPTNININSDSPTSEAYYSYRISSINTFGETNASSPIVLYNGSNDLGLYPNTISWDTVDGSIAYNIYGRVAGQEKLLASVTTNSYIDTGTDVVSTISYPNINSAIISYIIKLPHEEIIYMSDIICKNSETILENDIDYMILDGKYIKIISPLKILKTNEILYIDEYYVLNPIISKIFFWSFGETLSVIPIVNSYYNPYIDNYSIKQKADHLLHLVRALFLTLVSGPTMQNLRKALSLFYNVPFSYASGIASISTISGYNLITISNTTYKIPDTLVLSIVDGEEVNKYQLLADTIDIDDHISNISVIESLADPNNIYEKYNLLAIHVPSEYTVLGYYAKFINFFNTGIIPPNLKIKYY